MATRAVAREVVLSLRSEIAKIEGRLPERLEGPEEDLGKATLRRNGVPFRSDFLATGAGALDAALGGGLSHAALTEIHGCETRDAGAAAGFALGLAALILKEQTENRPLLWIGAAEIFREAGFPYAAGLGQAFGIRPESLLLAEVQKLLDALWIAEEAAQVPMLSAVIVEVRGNPEKLDLTATRRLHWRAAAAGRPVLLLRQAAWVEPTAAPVRLVVSPASAAGRETLAGPSHHSIGRPAFSVSIDKSRAALTGRFILEWNSHDLAFQEREPADSRRLVSLSRNGADLAPAPGPFLASKTPAGISAAGRQPSRKQYAKGLRVRRAG